MATRRWNSYNLGSIAEGHGRVGITLEERRSDSPLVERVWRSYSDDISTFVSVAVFQWDLVVWKQAGETYVNIQGAATHSSLAPVPQYAEFFGIIFKPGVFMPHLPPVVNRDLHLPSASGNAFWLNSDTWEIPTYENAETFVEWLVRDDLLVREAVVEAVLRGTPPAMSLRSIQRRFLTATGIPYRTMQQIERARRAALLLRAGTPILDAVFETGYFDQAHLTKSLKYYIGQTPTQLMNHAEELSLLYKTDDFC